MAELKRYAYNYAVIYRPLHMCNEVRTCTVPQEEASNEEYLYIRISTYDDSYMFKYYNEETKQWFLDSAMTQEWIPPVE